MIFERGRHTTYDFYIYNTLIETVSSFKYLGKTLYKNGNWFCTKKNISQHAVFSLFNLFKYSIMLIFQCPRNFPYLTH